MLQSILPDLYLRGPSKNYKNWEAKYLSPATCKACRDTHGKVCDFDTEHKPMHIACRCKIIPMRTKTVGTATDKGFDGADAWLMYQKTLPPSYITQKEALKQGWVQEKGNLSEALPKHSIGGDLFKNKRGKLPISPDRIWYEADINYTEGYRNTDRLLYSNDGLIFVSYDHYQTFHEITR